MITMPHADFARLQAVATAEHRNISQMIVVMILEGLMIRESGNQVTSVPATVVRSQPEPTEQPDKPAPKGVEPPQALKFKIRDNYFQLLNHARLTPTRLKELALGDEPKPGEIAKIERVLSDTEVTEK